MRATQALSAELYYVMRSPISHARGVPADEITVFSQRTAAVGLPLRHEHLPLQWSPVV